MSKHKLEIKWSYDSHDCEDCGSSEAIGAEVLLDGKVIVSKKAAAHCYAGSGDVDITGILLIALDKLGVEIIEEEGNSDLNWSRDTCYDWDLGPNGEINYIKL